MKVLIVGLGNIGLGLIAPVFQNAGYDVVGTDASKERLEVLKNKYFIQTPRSVFSKKIEVVAMEETANDFDLIITSVGRQNLNKVARWYAEKNLSAPVFLAENLPEPVDVFPRQIPIVVDRICPKVATLNNALYVVTEDYYSIKTLKNKLTEALKSDGNVGLLNSKEEVELERREKMFTVNTSHVVVAIYGKKLGYSFVEEAVKDQKIIEKIGFVLIEVGKLLSFGDIEAQARARLILKRFSAPLQDSLDRILGRKDRKLGNSYIDIPLKELGALGIEATALKEAQELYSKLD